jgi:hypothetical protein
MAAPLVRSTEEEALHLEMERISLDWCMIQNPTDEDFYIEWYNTKGTPWRYLVPAQHKDIGYGEGKREVQRYLAVWYCKHMAEKIINEKGQKMWEQMMKERQEKGQESLNEFQQQKAIWEKVPKTNSDQELANLYPNLFLGVTREFGTEYQPDQPYLAQDKSVQESVMEKLKDKRYGTETTATVKKVKPVENLTAPSLEDLEAIMPHTSKKELAEEISA